MLQTLQRYNHIKPLINHVKTRYPLVTQMLQLFVKVYSTYTFNGIRDVTNVTRVTRFTILFKTFKQNYLFSKKNTIFIKSYIFIHSL